MKDAPIISVVMPVYNAEKYVSEAIKSILNQTYANFEFLITNDGSLDHSLEILERHAEQDKRIRLITSQHRGCVAILNDMIAIANGEFIAKMDSDDVAMPERLEKQIRFLKENPNYVVVGASVLLIDSEGWPIRSFPKPHTHEEIDAAHMKGHGGAIVHPASMIRRSAIQMVGGYREQCAWAEDFDLFLRLAEIGKLANLSSVLLKYRVHYESISNRRGAEQARDANLAHAKACERRGLTPSLDPSVFTASNETSLGNLHRKWARWALQGKNIMTARKHAFLALKNDFFSIASWKVMVCAIRGW